MSGKLLAYGQFISTTTQSMSNSSTPVALTYDFSGPTKAMSYSGSQITVTMSGVYEILFSIQFARSSGNASTKCEAWLRKNGNDVADSATKVVTPQGPTTSQIFMSVPVMLQLNANDYIEIVFATDDYLNTHAYAFGIQTSPYARPGIPSIITNVLKVS